MKTAEDLSLEKRERHGVKYTLEAFPRWSEDPAEVGSPDELSQRLESYVSAAAGNWGGENPTKVPQRGAP